MAYTTIVTGTTVTSSWANASVRDQVVSPFASSAARTSAITVPVNGMISTQSSADTANGIYHYNGTSWRQPWNMPWGYIGTATAGSYTYNTGSGASAAMAVTLVNNRKYRIDVTISVNTGTATGSYDTWSLYDNTAASKILDFSGQIIGSGALLIIQGVGFYTSVATGSRNFTTQGIGSASASTRTVNPSTIYVTDEGPTGAPV